MSVSCAPAICSFVSGQVCFDAEGKLVANGKLGVDVTSNTVRRRHAPAPSICSRRSRPRSAISTRWFAWCALGGFINSAPDFIDGPKVLNGASDLMVAAFGDKGRHARTTVGVASLPADAAVEVEGLFEVA